MRKFSILGAVALAALVGNVTAAAAENPVDDLVGRWVDINALVSTRYTYSFDRPADGLQARVIDQKDNTITIDTASLFVSRLRDDEDFGFGLALDFGDAAQFTGSSQGDIVDSEDFELREAFVTYNLPFAGMSVKAGKFITLLGYEVLKTNESFNHNISHSILFGFSIPFTHTGVLLSAPIGDMVSVDVGIVNGWDNIEDNNSGKTLLAGVGIQPMDMLSMYAAGTYGSEQDSIEDGGAGAGSKRGVFTFNTVVNPIEPLTFVFDVVYGNESDLVPAVGGPEDADWYGFGGYAIFDVNRWFSVALRAEYFNDEGFRESFAPISLTGERVKIWEITPTVSFRLNDHVMVRAEYRHDEASDPIFAKANGRTQSGWDTIAAEILVGF